jgi:deoxyribose-phosphate aldolase
MTVAAAGRAALAARIEHTILRADATREDVERAVEAAASWGCHAVCVQPYWVRFLRAAPVAVVTVAGFPFGADPEDQKASAAARAAEDGAAEVDMVMNLGAFKSGDLGAVASDVRAVRRALPGRVLKVILEMGLLSRDEAERAARLCLDEGADYLKTCTGYGPRGVTVADVETLRRFGPVKASAGIRTFEQASALVAAGAARLGTSATAALLGPRPGEGPPATAR